MSQGTKDDGFMSQYLEACQEQIQKLAKDPQYFKDTLEPFMKMSQQFMADGMSLPSGGTAITHMDLNRVIFQIKALSDYIKEDHKALSEQHSVQDEVIEQLDNESRRLRSFIKKLIEKIENK